MAPDDRAELKKLYRKLAHKFHPDKMSGDERMMKRINQAYREANLEILRELDSEFLPEKEENTLDSLHHQLISINRLIEKANKELKTLKKSDMYILKKNLLKKNKANNQKLLDNLAGELKKEIAKNEERLDKFVEKFGPSEELAI